MSDPTTPAVEPDDEEAVYIGNIGAGDRQADWIKTADGGAAQRADLAAHHTIMADYYAAQGDTARAEQELHLAAILTGAISAPLPEDMSLPADDVIAPMTAALTDTLTDTLLADGWGNEEAGFGVEDDW